MSNQALTPYVFEDELVRVHQDENGDPWFVAKDVCRVLGIANSNDAVSRLDEDEKAGVGITDLSSNGVEQKRSFAIVSESGLYALVFRSNKPEAKAFRKWVTSEVLPSIRKTGRYDADELESDQVERSVRMSDVREKAWRLPLRTTHRVSMLNIALQVCKAEGAADELTVLARYVTMCEAVVGPPATEATQGEDDLVDRFMHECMELADGEKVGASTLYEAFASWCMSKGIKPPSIHWFGRRIHRHLDRQKSGTYRYVGARLLN